MESIWIAGQRFWQSIFYGWSEIALKEFNLMTCKETVKQSLKQKGRRQVTQVKTDKIKAQFQCRHLRQGRWLRVLQYRWNYRRTTWSESKDSKYQSCNSTNSSIHNRFSCGKIDSKPKSLLQLRDAGREDRICSEQDHPEFPSLEEGQPRGAESPKRGQISARKTDRLQDLRLLSSDWRSCSIRECWFILCYSSWWQHSGIRYKMGRSSIVDVKNSIRWYLGRSTVLERYRFATIKSWKPWVKRRKNQKLRLRNFDARHGRVESGAVIKSRKGLIGVEGGKSICYQWKEKGQCSKGDTCSFRHETKIVRRNQNTLPPHFLSQPHHEVEVCRGREVPEHR